MAQFHFLPSNYWNILNAILAIANSNGTFPSTKLGEVPTPEELSHASEANPDPNAPVTPSLPFLAVRHGRWRKYATSGEDNSGPPDAGMRSLQLVEPIWDFDVYMIFAYAPAHNADDGTYVPAVTNYEAAALVMAEVYQSFMNTTTLNGTCAISTVHSPAIEYIELGNAGGFTVAHLTVGAYERLYSDYE